MGITLSHASALRTMRFLRANGANFHEMDRIALSEPTPWVRGRWSMLEFAPGNWCWSPPSAAEPLDVLVGAPSERLRMNNVRSHVCRAELPASSIIWLDEHASIPCPPLLFIQMAELVPLPALVLLGHELCGHFTRHAGNPAFGPVIDGIRPATSVEEIRDYLASVSGVAGMRKVRRAVSYVADHALSAPEAVLATMYSLPETECGYGMGPVTLNQRIELAGASGASGHVARYPDILFSFAPMGINYDGERHLDLPRLVKVARDASLAEAESQADAERALLAVTAEIREKAVDDIWRTRELASQGFLVFPVVKEDLEGRGRLDMFTRQVLACARTVFGIDTSRFERALEDRGLARDRQRLLDSLLPPNASAIF